MTDANPLQKAYELIEVDKLDEARAILEPIIAVEKDNADAWWLYAHSVYDQDAARGALQNVLRIDPEYPEASSLLIMLDQQVALQPQQSGVTLTQPPLKTLKSIGTPSAAPVPASVGEDEDTPDFSSDNDEIDFDDTLPDEEEPSKSRFPISMPIIAVLVVIIIIILGLFIVSLFNPTGTLPPESTNQAVDSTTGEPTVVIEFATLTPQGGVVEPTLDMTATEIVGENQSVPTQEGTKGETATPEDSTNVEPTQEGNEPIATDESGGGQALTPAEAQEQLLEGLGDFTLAENPVETMQTDLGSTYVVTVCSTPEELRTTAIGAMDVIADNGENFNTVDALGLRVNDCDTGATLRILGVSRQDAVDYASGALSDDDFQSKWEPLG